MSVNVVSTETKVIIDDMDNVQVITVGIQGPEGAQGPSGPPGPGSGNSAIRTVSTDTNMTISDVTLRADSTAGNITISLASSSETYDPIAGTGQIFNVAKFIEANQVIVNCQDSNDRINGGTSIIIYLEGNLQVQAGPDNSYTVL